MHFTTDMVVLPFFVFLVSSIIFSKKFHINVVCFEVWFMFRVLFWFAEYCIFNLLDNLPLKIREMKYPMKVFRMRYHTSFSAWILFFRIVYIITGIPVVATMDFMYESSNKDQRLREQLDGLYILVFMGYIFVLIDTVIVFVFACGAVISYVLCQVCR